MVAIETKYVGPSNVRGSRIIATTESGHRVVISYPQELSGEAAHRKAAVELCKRKFHHEPGDHSCERLIAGGTKKGYVFVFLPLSCQCSSDAFRGLRRGRR